MTQMTVESKRVSEIVIEAIANQADVDPLDLGVPLGTVIDPDALDALFTSPFDDALRDGRVEFTYCDYQVTVNHHSETGITVDVTPIDSSLSTESIDSSSERTQV